MLCGLRTFVWCIIGVKSPFSQQIAPSNATLLNDSHQYSLMSTAVPNISSFKMQPLTNDAGLDTICLFHILRTNDL